MRNSRLNHTVEISVEHHVYNLNKDTRNYNNSYNRL